MSLHGCFSFYLRAPVKKPFVSAAHACSGYVSAWMFFFLSPSSRQEAVRVRRSCLFGLCLCMDVFLSISELPSRSRSCPPLMLVRVMSLHGCFSFYLRAPVKKPFVS